MSVHYMKEGPDTSDKETTIVSQSENMDVTENKMDAVTIENQKQKTPLHIYKNVICVSLGFTLLFSSFNAVANLQSSINKLLGIIALWVTYATFIISCLFVPSILTNRIQSKWTMPLCMVAYSTYFAAQFYPRHYTLIPTAFLVGLAAAPLWSSKSSYVTEISLIYSKRHNVNKEIIITRVFGLFFSMYHLSKIIGNYIVSAVISSRTENSTFEDFDKCGANFCPIYLENLTRVGSQQTEEHNAKEVQVLIAILLGLSFAAIIIMLIFVDPLSRIAENDSQQKKSDNNSLIWATLRQLRNRNQLLIIPITFWMGIQHAFVSVDFTVAFITCSSGIQMIGYVMMCYGISDAISAMFITSFLVKYTGRIFMFSITAALHLGILLALLFWKPAPNNQTVLFIMAALWGICDAVWQTQTSALYGTLFSDKTMAAFSNYNLWKSCGFMVAYLTSGLFCIDVKLYILIGVLVLAIFCYYVLESLPAPSDLKLNGKRINNK